MTAPPRATLAACIIAFNEEDRIGDCLDSVAWADEILVVDSGSTDRTVAIASAKGARVIVRDWPGYAEQKNFALGRAAADWVLSIDADERVTTELAAAIRGLLAAPDEGVAGASMPRRTWYLGRWIRHGGWYPDRRVRLVRRGRGRWEGEHVHERLVADGSVRALDGDLLHLTYRGLADQLRTIDRYTTEAARELSARGARGALGGMIVNPPLKFLKMYLLKAGFLDGVPGLCIALLAGHHASLKHMLLREIQREAAANGTGKQA
jgi:glycosyltransferase involved in cell wall biosynthesis